MDLQNFDNLYTFQNIHPYEILRWFDNSIFGINPSQANVIGNNINLTEGFLLSTATIVPFLLVIGLFRQPLQWLKLWGTSRNEISFFFWVMIFCISVVVIKPITNAVWVLFLSMDFTHARILIAGLLPLSALVALTMSALPPSNNLCNNNLKTNTIGFIAGLIAALIIDLISGQFQDILFGHLRIEALVRIGLSFFILHLLLWGTLKASANISRVSYIAIGSLLIGQCLLAANQQVNGPQAFNFSKPFDSGDFYQARYNEFKLPNAEQLRILHQRLEPDKYRIVLLCDKNIANGFCAGHVPEFWKLRAIDGYYGLGVPRRLRALPWSNGLSLRTISFTNIDLVPWELLGLLNVRSALVASDGVFRNIVLDGNRITDYSDPNTFEIMHSPARVTPRAFFTAAIQPAKSPQDAADQLFRLKGVLDPMQTSFVEGINQKRLFENGSPIEIKESGDVLELKFSSSTSERFLVLNELYFPGWRAISDGSELPIMPTNGVMRGVFVPAGATKVQFKYIPFVNTTEAQALQIIAILTALFCFLYFFKIDKKLSCCAKSQHENI